MEEKKRKVKGEKDELNDVFFPLPKDELNDVFFPLPKDDNSDFYDELITCYDAIWDLIKKIKRKK
ncbi:MAG: hypothetical protein ACFFD2_19240 [Promethearchaeota archaeon]